MPLIAARPCSIRGAFAGSFFAAMHSFMLGVVGSSRTSKFESELDQMGLLTKEDSAEDKIPTIGNRHLHRKIARCFDDDGRIADPESRARRRVPARRKIIPQSSTAARISFGLEDGR